MEQLVLNTLGFQLHLPTALSYLGTLTTILDIDADVAHRAAFISVRASSLPRASTAHLFHDDRSCACWTPRLAAACPGALLQRACSLRCRPLQPQLW